MRIGVHVPILRPLKESVSYAVRTGCTAFQIFPSNPRGWFPTQKPEHEIEAFRAAIMAAKISPVVIHMPYLINLASADPDIRGKSLRLFIHTLTVADMLGAEMYVIHPGSARNTTPQQALENLAEGLKEAYSRQFQVEILIENTAGQGALLGKTWKEFGDLAKKVGNQTRFCFDTAHAFAAGYDLSSQSGFEKMCEEIEENIGMEYIKLIHANDSARGLATAADRHADIGEGFLGEEAFVRITGHPVFRNLPYILETPKNSEEDDRRNIERLKKIYHQHSSR
ncbi:MAG: deoxyribonuclease IV [Candidatus Ratteibacteria bacterium]|jgi:deoxyribonuclease-4